MEKLYASIFGIIVFRYQKNGKLKITKNLCQNMMMEEVMLCNKFANNLK